MKKILILFILVLAAAAGFSQTPVQFLGSPKNRVEIRGQSITDSIMWPTLRDTNFIPPFEGAINFRPMDGIYYGYVGAKWQPFLPGIFQPKVPPSNIIKQYWNGFENFVTFNTDSIPEGSTNLYYTNARARASISLTTTGTSGAATYNSSTGVLNVPNYTTAGGSGTLDSVGLSMPTIFSVTNSPLTGTGGTIAVALQTQNTNRFFAGPASGGAAIPTFRAMTIADLPTGIPNANLANSNFNLSIGSTGTSPNWAFTTVNLGSTEILNLPQASAVNTGILLNTDWTTFNNKVTSVNGQTGVTVVGNADSIKKLPVDTTSNRQGYVLTFDSLNHKWYLSPGGSGGGTTYTIGAIDGNGAAANGASISGSSIFMQSASTTNPGLVNNAVQSFSGNKTFIGSLTLTGLTAKSPTTTDSSLLRDASGKLWVVPFGALTASNGLGIINYDVELGGPLTKIDTLTMTGTNVLKIIDSGTSASFGLQLIDRGSASHGALSISNTSTQNNILVNISNSGTGPALQISHSGGSTPSTVNISSNATNNSLGALRVATSAGAIAIVGAASNIIGGGPGTTPTGAIVGQSNNSVRVAAFSGAVNQINAGDTAYGLAIYRNPVTAGQATNADISIGSYLSTALGVGAATSKLASLIRTIETDTVNATFTTSWHLGLANAGATVVDKFVLSGNGKLQLNGYVPGAFTGTPTGDLSVDASGNVIQRGTISATTPVLFNTSTGVISFATSGSGAGSCTNCNLTYDVYGRITVANNGSGGSGNPNIQFKSLGTNLNASGATTIFNTANSLSGVASGGNTVTYSLTNDSLINSGDWYYGFHNGRYGYVNATDTIFYGNGISVIGTTGDTAGLGGRLFQNTIISGANLYAMTYDSFPAASGRGFRVNFGSDAGWDMVVRDSATGFWTRIAKGTPGQALTMLSTGGIGWGAGGGGAVGYSVTTAVNTANYTTPTGRRIFVYLSDLTGQANRNVVLPAATNGDEFVFVNLNTSSSTFSWTFTSGTVKDNGQNTITTLANLLTYHLVFGGTNYQIIN